MMKQAFAATNKSVTIAASLCIHDAPLTYRLTDSLSYLSYGNDEALQQFKVSIMEQ